MARIGLGIGVQYSRVLASIDPQAQAHYDRVIADGGIIPAGLLGCNAWFVAVKAVYAVTDITTAISAGYDPHYLGAKIGAGSGTTLGQAATKLYSCSGASGDLVQATAASMPLLLVKNSGDANYWFGSGVNGNRISATSYTTAYTSIDFNTLIKCDSVSVGETNTIFSMSNDEIFQLYTNTTTTYYLIFYWRNAAGVQKYAQSSAILMTNINNKYIKVTVENSGLDQICKMYNSVDNINFSLLYQQTITTSTGFTNGSKVPTIGAYNLVSGEFKGKIYRATLSNSIGGTPVVDFNPASYNAATSQTQWTSTTGEVWAINTGTAATGYKGVLVDRTILQGDGVDDAMTTSAFAINQPNTSYSAFANYTNVGAYSVADGISGDSRNFYNNAAAPTQRGLYVSGAGAGVIYSTGFTLNKLELVVFGLNSSSTYAIRNNGSRVLGSVGTANCNGQSLFVGGNNYSNTLLTTHIITNSQDTPTQNTAMYNAIKSFNNSSF